MDQAGAGGWKNGRDREARDGHTLHQGRLTHTKITGREATAPAGPATQCCQSDYEKERDTGREWHWRRADHIQIQPTGGERWEGAGAIHFLWKRSASRRQVNRFAQGSHSAASQNR